MYRKIQLTVTIEQQYVDGCGNRTEPITEGMVRQAIERLDSVHSVNVTMEDSYVVVDD